MSEGAKSNIGAAAEGCAGEHAVSARSLLEDGSSGCSARMTYPKALLHCADSLVPPDNATAALALHVQDNVYQR
jgi:hypothetical protein